MSDIEDFPLRKTSFLVWSWKNCLIWNTSMRWTFPSIPLNPPDGEERDEENTEEENTVPDIAAQLVHSSLCHYLSTLYLNLYQNHFSYIKDLKKYAKSYSCSRCGTLWKHVGMLNRLKWTCEAKEHYQFPVGAYVTCRDCTKNKTTGSEDESCVWRIHPGYQKRARAEWVTE